ncbi:ATP--cob(I)alamin adenosyltransferase [Halalkalibacter okhensis]|uniref:ATP:cob(I)alamin adenosyltransferase n=1 Tax=Halalkalibacter okhensis TaxID=333138 RepID=A0A0B0IDM2_9BACI|nr:ATP--cob(I)alamin adenosyltransferase [Halalkalibacter okhensis]KHF38962.1 ATP:cob(I)alamin adenosyltransferase [Halalkalibacter okhensis]
MSLPKKSTLTQEIVLRMLNQALQKAEDLRIKISIAIVDDGGNLMGFIRMNGAKVIPSNIAQNKAYTAAGFGLPTGDWYERIKDKPSLLHGIVHTEKMTIFSGGQPIYDGVDLIGGIGVSGGSEEQDNACALAGLSVLNK